MKKLLCYLVLIFLVLLIATPPLLRMFYKDEVPKTLPDKFQLLICVKDTYNISTSYKNNEAMNIKFTHLQNDPNLEEYTDQMSLEYTLDAILKEHRLVSTNTSSSDDKEMISYLLTYDNMNTSELGEFSNYRLSLNEQKQSYINEGYSCNVVE